MVNTCIDKEARECIDKNSFKKKAFKPTADQYIPMWIYVICNADINNLLTECSILHDFRLRDLSLMSEADYNVTLFMNAVDMFKKEGGMLSSSSQKYSNITPYYIFSKTSLPENQYDGGIQSRSQSMSTVNTKLSHRTSGDRGEDGFVSNFTSSIKGLFK